MTRKSFRFGSLFAGIGGFDLGLERAGMTCAWQVEIDPFCNKILARHWPNVRRYDDIKTCGKKNLEKVDLICGGFPCQPFSVAGKRRGASDDRHLWPHMLRIIREMRPAWVIGENVGGFVRMALDQVLSDLEGEGYTCETFVLPAASLNAPHRRDRCFIISHTSQLGLSGIDGRRPGTVIEDRHTQSEPDRHAADTEQRTRLPGYENETVSYGCRREWTESWYKVALGTCVRRVDDGIPRRVDRVARLKALGNAVVPQLVEVIGRAIMEVRK